MIEYDYGKMYVYIYIHIYIYTHMFGVQNISFASFTYLGGMRKLLQLMDQLDPVVSRSEILRSKLCNEFLAFLGSHFHDVRPISTGGLFLVGGLVVIFYFPIYWE